MSKGYATQKPEDLKGKRAWVWREDPVLPTLFQQAGSVSVPTSLPEVIPELWLDLGGTRVTVRFTLALGLVASSGVPN